MTYHIEHMLELYVTLGKTILNKSLFQTSNYELPLFEGLIYFKHGCCYLKCITTINLHSSSMKHFPTLLSLSNRSER